MGTAWPGRLRSWSRRIAVLSAVSLTVACAGRTVVIPNPRNALVTVNERPLPGNVLEYGRWIGNEYAIQVSAPGFHRQEVVAAVHMGDRAAGIALVCAATVLGIPLVPAVLWNGELDDQIYVSLKQHEPEMK